MQDDNPYAPPTRQVAPVDAPVGDEDGALAGRLARLVAVLVDSLLLAAVLVPLQLLLGVYDGFPMMEPMGFGETALWTAASFAMMVAINGWLYATRAQSVGKLLLGIKIVDLEGHDADFQTIVFKRLLPVTAASAVPFVGGLFGLIDALMIFRRDRRCLHDHIAGTRVVRAQ